MSIQHRHNPELYADELRAAEREMIVRTGLGLPDFIHDMMRAEDEKYDIRVKAGWELDDGGWTAPNGMSEWDWVTEGFSLPEDE